jgi:non-ribosomal peptide synthetase component F
MFGTLCYGGTLVLKEPTDPFEHLKRVHAAIITPSVLSACLPAEHPHLDTIVVGGEPVPQSMTEIWGAGRSLINGYGPSEVSSSRFLNSRASVDRYTCLSAYSFVFISCPIMHACPAQLEPEPADIERLLP